MRSCTAKNAKKYSPKKRTAPGISCNIPASIRGKAAKYAAVSRMNSVSRAKTVPKKPAVIGKSGTTITAAQAKPKKICAGNTPMSDAGILPSPTEVKAF